MMGQIKVVKSGSKKFRELKKGEVFRSGVGRLYLKVDNTMAFSFEDMVLQSSLMAEVDAYPVNATLTVEE
jgi:hypothetical protein